MDLCGWVNIWRNYNDAAMHYILMLLHHKYILRTCKRWTKLESLKTHKILPHDLCLCPDCRRAWFPPDSLWLRARSREALLLTLWPGIKTALGLVHLPSLLQTPKHQHLHVPVHCDHHYPNLQCPRCPSCPRFCLWSPSCCPHCSHSSRSWSCPPWSWSCSWSPASTLSRPRPATPTRCSSTWSSTSGTRLCWTSAWITSPTWRMLTCPRRNSTKCIKCISRVSTKLLPWKI